VRAIGLDVHRDFCEVALAGDGAVISAGRIETTPAALELFAGSLGRDDRVALEVSGNAFEIARIIEPHVGRVLIVGGADTGIRPARAKTDRLEARALARLLATGSLEGLWRPDGETRALRRRLSRRQRLLRARTPAKNEVHAALMRRLITRPKVGDLFGQAGREWLASLELPSEERATVTSSLRQIDLLSEQIEPVEGVIAEAALRSPGAKRLTSVPGVDVVWAASFMAAVGDIARFSPRRKPAGYPGLDPRVRGRLAGRPWPHLKAGLGTGTLGARGGRDQRRAPAGAAARLLRAHPLPPRSPGRRRRRRAQARLPVPVPAHPRRGLRLRAAVLDEEEAAPARAQGRRPQGRGRARAVVDQQSDAQGRARTRAPGRACLRAHRRRPASRREGKGGRERHTGTRHLKAVQRQAARQGIGPRPRALARRRPRPRPPLQGGAQKSRRTLIFIGRAKRKPCSCGSDAERRRISDRAPRTLHALV
jgi:hypothetical protein